MCVLRYLLVAGVLALFASSVSGQAIFRVDGDNGSVDGDGAGWQGDAFKYLQDAVVAANEFVSAPGATAEIWIKGDTAQPYLPNQRSGTVFSQTNGTFSYPAIGCTGEWTDKLATITLTPWAGTIAGQPHTVTVEIPSDLPLTCYDNNVAECDDVPLRPSSGSEIVGVLDNRLYLIDGPANVLVRDFTLLPASEQHPDWNTHSNAFDEARGGPYSIRRGQIGAEDYSFFGDLSGSDVFEASFVDVVMLGGLSGQESTARLNLRSGNDTKLVVFGGDCYGPTIDVGDPPSRKQCWRLHGVDDVAYVEHTFHNSEHTVGVCPDVVCTVEEYRVLRAFYINCVFHEDQEDKGSVTVGTDQVPSDGIGTEAWFYQCDFNSSAPVLGDNGTAHFLNCTLNGEPYGPQDHSFIIANNITLRGGFEGDENAPEDRDEPPCTEDPANCIETILSGDIAQDDDPNTPATFDDNVLHVVTGVGLGVNNEIDRLTITGGAADDSMISHGEHGAGALLLDSVSGGPAVEDCIFTSNIADGDGSGIYLASPSDPTSAQIAELRGNRFELNGDETSASGGAVHSENKLVLLTSTFKSNESIAGGAVRAAELRMDNCKFFGNTTRDEGGALHVDYDAVLNNCLFAENSVSESADNGAASYFAGDFEIFNATFAENSGNLGAGILYDTGSFNRKVHNSILYFNGAAASEQSEIYPDFVSNGVTFTYNCVQDLTSSSTGSISGDPEFKDLSAGDAENRDYELDETIPSPCIDEGNMALLAYDDAHDIDGDGDQNENIPDLKLQFRVGYDFIDMGAYEYYDPSLCPADLTDDQGSGIDMVVNVMDLLELLGNWGTNGPGADLAAPTNEVDVFDLIELLANWGPCGRGVDIFLSDDECYDKYGTQWSQQLEDCLEAVAQAEGYLSE